MAGTFILSLDTELAWGTIDKGGYKIHRRKLEVTRKNIEKLLAILSKHDIPATWAFVGHLFLENCTRNKAREDPHPDVLTVDAPKGKVLWHDDDPATNRVLNPLWYGDDIIDNVRRAQPEHEIGCHTFSHLILKSPNVTEEITRSQLNRCQELANEKGIVMRSFVFPRNQVAHLSVLKESGFICFRGPERSWYARLPRPFSRAGHFFSRLFALTPPVYKTLQIESGLVEIPASMFLMPPDGVRKIIPGNSRVRQAISGLRKSVDNDAVFHLWFHPWNIGESDVMLDWLDRILGYVNVLKSQNKLRVMTMSALAHEYLNN